MVCKRLTPLVNSQRADTFAVHVIRVPYDIERAIQQAAEEHMPELEPYAEELRTAQYRGTADKMKRFDDK